MTSARPERSGGARPRRACTAELAAGFRLLRMRALQLQPPRSRALLLCRADEAAQQYDVAGVFGAVCDHVICTSAVLMTGGETYNYAAMLLLRLVQQLSVPSCVYYDIACKFAPWFRNLLPNLPLNTPGTALEGLSDGERACLQLAVECMPMLVAEFHALMHNAACQSQNSFRARDVEMPGRLRPAGETTEQYWAYFGGGSLLRLKYMSRSNFTLVLESMMQNINRGNDARLASWLVARVRALLAELRRTDEELATFRALVRARKARSSARACLKAALKLAAVALRDFDSPRA